MAPHFDWKCYYLYSRMIAGLLLRIVMQGGVVVVVVEFNVWFQSHSFASRRKELGNQVWGLEARQDWLPAWTLSSTATQVLADCSQAIPTHFPTILAIQFSWIYKLMQLSPAVFCPPRARLELAASAFPCRVAQPLYWLRHTGGPVPTEYSHPCYNF